MDSIDDDMTTGENHQRQVGFFVTLKEIHEIVIKLDGKMDHENNKMKEELARVKSQIAAQWVIHGILVTTIAFLVQRGLSIN